MDQADIYKFLSIAFADIFGRDDIVLSPELAAKDVVGWDSFKQVEIVLALEEQYGIRIRTKELNDIANVGDLVNLVSQKVKPV
jgi:acyl carrier protein